jgi:hypothetical protein
MRKTILAILLALVLTVVPAASAFAANPVIVTVTATPAAVSLSVDFATWTVNGITGDSKMRENTTYYSNPLGDETAPSATVANGDCRFQFTKDGNVAIDITCDFADFTGGDAMTNSNGGYAVNGANAFGASGYESGKDWPTDAVIFKNSGSAIFISNLAISATDKWGIALLTQSAPFVSTTGMTSTITCAAVEHVP